MVFNSGLKTLSFKVSGLSGVFKSRFFYLNERSLQVRHFKKPSVRKKTKSNYAANEHVPFPGQGPGPEGLKYVIAAFLSAFPDIHWMVEEQVAEAEKVVSRFTMTGTHQGEFLGIPATGKSVNVWGVVIDVVRDGKFAESRIIMDTLGLMQQLGVIPASS